MCGFYGKNINLSPCSLSLFLPSPIPVVPPSGWLSLWQREEEDRILQP